MPDDGHSNKVAVITGGASGIGFATAKLLSEQGWRLVLADIEKPRLDEACAGLSNATEVAGVPTDVSSRDAVEGLADAAFDRFGRVDMVFNNAGVAIAGATSDMTHDDWTWLIDVNLWGPIHGVEVFLPRLIEQGQGGHLLFTASFAGLTPNVGLGPYCVTKYGVVGLAEVLYRENKHHRIGVSVLCPMRVATDINQSIRNRPADLDDTGALPPMPESEIDERMAGRVLPVEEVARHVVAAIGTDRLYIVPHEESRAMIRRRFDRIDRAFEPDPT